MRLRIDFWSTAKQTLNLAGYGNLPENLSHCGPYTTVLSYPQSPRCVRNRDATAEDAVAR